MIGYGAGAAEAPKPVKGDADINDNNYDEFSGYGGSLFNDTPYEQVRLSVWRAHVCLTGEVRLRKLQPW